MHDRNVEKLRQIADYVGGRGFHICLENLFRRGAERIEQLQSVIARTGSDCFGITLDTGHLNMSRTDTQRDFIRKAGGMLRAVHIADNEGAADQHMMPFGRGNVDFAEVVQALREVGYQGPFNFELPGEINCPMEIREAKLDYIRSIYNYLMR
jgi:sugar phosphate isomerase/epimerase